MRPSVQLLSVYCYSSSLWWTSLYFLLFTMMIAIIVAVFDVLMSVTLTFDLLTENWHSTYSCHGGIYTNFDYSYISSFLSCEPMWDRQTGKTI